LERGCELSLYTDGAARGNPGPAAIGYAVFDAAGNLVESDAKTVGRRTNNEAEYEALLWGLEKAAARSRGKVRVCMDSQLVVRQLRGEYRISEDRLRLYAKKVLERAGEFESVEFIHVPRENPRTEMVDELVNAALDREGS